MYTPQSGPQMKAGPSFSEMSSMVIDIPPPPPGPFLINTPTSRSRKISVHTGHQTVLSKVTDVVVGDQLNELFEDVLATMPPTQTTLQQSTSKIYEKDENGNKVYIEDLGDLIEVLDEKEQLDVLHVYLEQQTSMEEIAEQPSAARRWSMQNTPIASRQSSVASTQSGGNLHDLKSQPLVPCMKPAYSYSESDSSSSSSSSSSSLTPPKQRHNAADSEHVAEVMTALECDRKLVEKYGYKIIESIEDTIHGCVYKAEKMKVNEDNQHKYVAIKKVEKNTVKLKGDIDDENILKESVILHYLTRLNKPPSSNICAYIEFMEHPECYMLVMEYGGDTNLKQFMKMGHEYICNKKLSVNKWRTVVKYIIWQLTSLLNWMHNDMMCCHLDLTLENILVQNVEFVVHPKNGSVSIDSSKLTIKLIDFGFAEIWPNIDCSSGHIADDEKKQKASLDFKCNKHGLTKDYIHKSPQAFHADLIYDARKDDVFCLGVILYSLLIGRYPYAYPEDDDFNAIKQHQIYTRLVVQNQQHLMKKSALKMLEGLLEIQEEQRMDITQILHSDWFKHYYSRYRTRLQQKSQSQRTRHVRQAQKLKALPYYSLTL